jgi:hypothetical protein
MANGQGQVTIPNAPLPGARYTEDWYIYLASTTNLGIAGSATASIPVNINIQADSDFKLLKLTHFCNSHASITNQQESTRVLPLVTVQIQDTGSGRNLFSNPIPLPAIAGDGRVPFLLPIARIFKASATITVTFTNYDTAIAYDINLALVGTKLFRMS